MATGSYPPPRLFSVAFITPKGDPIYVQAFNMQKTASKIPADLLKANYVGNCSLDIFEERGKSSGDFLLVGYSEWFSQLEAENPKATECFLGLLISMDGLSIYGYITPTKVKIVASFTLSETYPKDSEVIMVRIPSFFICFSLYHR